MYGQEFDPTYKIDNKKKKAFSPGSSMASTLKIGNPSRNEQDI
jgi:hypothetical protein